MRPLLQCDHAANAVDINGNAFCDICNKCFYCGQSLEGSIGKDICDYCFGQEDGPYEKVIA